MSATILEIQKKIRRSLQGPLYDAALAAGITMPNSPEEPAICWGSAEFDRADLQNYFAATVSIASVRVLEVGPNPMFEATGIITITARSPAELGEDGNDVLAGIIATAYPYASTPTFDGISVFIDTAQHRGYGSEGPYTTGVVVVDWNIYRRP